MNIEKLERLEELKKFGKIKRTVTSVPYFDNFISSRSFLLRTLD